MKSLVICFTRESGIRQISLNLLRNISIKLNFFCELSIIHFIKNAGWLILSNVIVVRVE